MLLERNPVDAPSLSLKDRERRAIERQVKAFLRAGGIISAADSAEIPCGVWLGTDTQAKRTLVSVNRFSTTTGLAVDVIKAAVRAGTLRGYIYKAELHVVNTHVRAYAAKLKGITA